MKQTKNKALYDVTPELMVDGKPISEWAKDQGWIQIGTWQIDPKALSIKWINEILEFEIRNAKKEALQEFRDILNEKNKVSNNLDVIVRSNSVFIDAEQILLMIDSLIKSYEPKNELPMSEGIES